MEENLKAQVNWNRSRLDPTGWSCSTREKNESGNCGCKKIQGAQHVLDEKSNVVR